MATRGEGAEEGMAIKAQQGRLFPAVWESKPDKEGFQVDFPSAWQHKSSKDILV